MLKKRGFLRQSFEKYIYIKIHENPLSVSRVVTYERADRETGRHDEFNSRFWQFCERA